MNRLARRLALSGRASTKAQAYVDGVATHGAKAASDAVRADVAGMLDAIAASKDPADCHARLTAYYRQLPAPVQLASVLHGRLLCANLAGRLAHDEHVAEVDAALGTMGDNTLRRKDPEIPSFPTTRTLATIDVDLPSAHAMATLSDSDEVST